MTNLLVVILHDETYLPDLLQAWQNVGLPGATIIDSVGAYRATTWLDQVGLGAIGDLFARAEQSKILLAALDDDSKLEEAVTTVEEIIGDLNAPYTGLYFVIPIARSGGITIPIVTEDEKDIAFVVPRPTAKGDAITRNTRVSEVGKILNLGTIIVRQEQTLIEVAEAMAEHPRSNVACVVNEQQRLVGLIPLRLLADDLFSAVVPGNFLKAATNVEDAIRFAKMAQSNIASDVMIKPVWVKKDDLVKDAFRKMRELEISAIPIVNEQRQVTGVINLRELIVLYTRSQKILDK